jgi:CheY-like chemotaxis protein
MTFGAGFRILLVEDKPDSRDAAIEALERILKGCEIVWAPDRDDALSKLELDHFDLAVCDLKLPARANELDTDESNGFAVISALEQDHPGTPIIILSAWASLDNTETHTSSAAVVAAYGVAQLRMCQVAVKGRPDDIEARLQVIAEGLKRWELIAVSSSQDTDEMLVRAIRHLSTVRGYNSALIDRAGGLSGSLNALVTLKGPGRLPMTVFVKMDDAHWITDEENRRRDFVEGHLEPGDWAPTLEIQTVGLRDRAASFSSLSTGNGFFHQLSVSPNSSGQTVKFIEEAVSPWTLPDDPVAGTIGDLRRTHLSDAKAIELEIDISEFQDLEIIEITHSRNVIHGDLHGENVLVRPDLRPLLIDFAYTEVGPNVADAVALEMSLLFHPGTPMSEDALADVRYMKWAEGQYLPDLTFQPFVESCRAWALRTTDELPFLAVSYAHAIRHLKHDNVNRERALSVARSISVRIEQLVATRDFNS